jgi:hypothetical protein
MGSEEVTNTFAEDHAAGLHQQEIVELLREIEPVLEGHSRLIIIIALTRLIAAMLGPTDKKSRDRYLKEIIDTARNILREMDKICQ